MHVRVKREWSPCSVGPRLTSSVGTLAGRPPLSQRLHRQSEIMGTRFTSGGQGYQAYLLRLHGAYFEEDGGKARADAQGAGEWDREVLATMIGFADLHSIHF